MVRLLEIGLFLLPFAVFALWRVAGGGVPSLPLLGFAVGFALLLAAALVWFSSHDTLRPGQTYVPAQLRGGTIVPGHADRP